MNKIKLKYYALVGIVFLLFIVLDLMKVPWSVDQPNDNPPDFHSTTREMPTVGTPDQLSKHYRKINSTNPDDGFFNKWVAMTGRVRNCTYFAGTKTAAYYEIEFMTNDPLPLIKVKISEREMRKQKFFKHGRVKHGQKLTICAKCMSGDASLVLFDYDQ